MLALGRTIECDYAITLLSRQIKEDGRDFIQLRTMISNEK